MKYAIYALPVLLATLFGLIFTGVIHIPGVSPEKKKAAASGVYADATDEKPESETESDAAQKAEPPEGKPEEAKSQTDSQKAPPEDSAVPPPAATAASSATPATASPQSATADEAPSDPLSGQKALAKLWNTMEASALVAIVADWSDDDLALQLSVMKADKVAELLAALKPERASKISKLLQKAATKAQ